MKDKALLPMLLIMLTLPLVTSGWIGHGVTVGEKGNIITAVSNGTGFHTMISPMMRANVTWNCSFSVKTIGTKSIFVESGYFSSNGSFLFAKTPKLIGNGSFGWKSISILVPAYKNANLSALIFAINGSGKAEIANFTCKKAVLSPKATHSTPEPPTTKTPSEEHSSTASPQSTAKNIKKLVINDTSISVVILLNGTYHPGGTMRADFFITNKAGTLDEVNIALNVYYFGIKVFSYSHPSWREYPAGKTVHIYQESKLPAITPPGKYKLKFYITPVGRETLEVSGEITVLPNLEWFLLMGLLLALIAGAVYLILRRERYLGWLVRAYDEFSVGQKFIFFAIIGLIVSAIILALGAENYANDVAIFVYYLLLVGVLNLWVEYFEPRWDNEGIREGFSVLLLAGLAYLSRDVFTPYPSVVLVILGAIMLGSALKERVREWTRGKKRGKGVTPPKITEIEIIGKTEDGFIIFKEKGDDNEK